MRSNRWIRPAHRWKGNILKARVVSETKGDSKCEDRAWAVAMAMCMFFAAGQGWSSTSAWDALEQRDPELAAMEWSPLESEILSVLTPEQLESWLAGASNDNLILATGESLADFLTLRGASELSLTWSSIDGGGGVSEGGVFRLTSSLGQPDASSIVMAAGGFALTGGFLTIPARSRDRVGIYRDRLFLLDVDGSGTIAPPDQACLFGIAGDVPILGDWDGDGHDEIGVYRDPGLFLMDLDGSCSWTPATDRACQFGLDGEPIIGDWNGDGDDDIGVYRPSQRLFFMDLDEGCTWTQPTDQVFLFGLSGDRPIIGDWNGDGDDDIGIYRPSNRLYLMDRDESGTWTPPGDLGCLFGLVKDKPIIGDWNRDGDDNIGVYRPINRLFLMDQDENCRFSLPEDLWAIFGLSDDAPIIGKW